MVFNTGARDYWPDSLQRVLNSDYLVGFAGPRIMRRTFRGLHYVDMADSFAVLARLGGNYDAHFYHFDRGGGRRALQFRQMPDGRLLLGTRRATASALLRAPSYHLRGRAVLQRLPEAGDGPVYADFKLVEHGAAPENRLWGARLTLPAGQQSVELPFELDTLGHRAELWVVPAENAPTGFFAGFRELELTHSIEGSILLAASLGARDESLPPHARTNFELVRSNIEVEARLIDDLLDQGGISRGRTRLTRTLLDLHEVLEQALRTTTSEFTEKEIDRTRRDGRRPRAVPPGWRGNLRRPRPRAAAGGLVWFSHGA